MSYKPFLIANQRTGLELDLEPWLLPGDGYAQIDNAYLYQGVLTKRQGYTEFGRMVHNVDDELLATGDGSHKTYAGTLAHYPIRAGDLEIETVAEIFSDNGQGVLTGSLGGTGTITYTSGVYSVTFKNNVGNNVKVYAEYNYYPGLPVMGLFNYITQAGSEQLIAFNTKRANVYSAVTGLFTDITGTDTWTGGATDYFWAHNWQNKMFIINGIDQVKYYNGTTILPLAIDTTEVAYTSEVLGTGTGLVKTYTGVLAHPPLKLLTLVITDGTESFTDNGDGTMTGSLGGTGTISNYSTGAYSVTFNANVGNGINVYASYTQGGVNYVTGGVYLTDYKNRLVLFRPIESGIQMNQRIRWSSVGTYDTWPAANWLDADGAAWLDMGAFLQDYLVGFFERGVSILNYTGDSRLPFIWQQIAANEGTIAAFSVTEFEDEVLFMSVTRISSTNGQQIQYIDNKIPSLILSMKYSMIRQSYAVLDEPLRQWWLAYPSINADTGLDQIIIYNMDDGAWSRYDLPINVFGYFEKTSDLIWRDCTFNWEDAGFKWNDRNLQGGYPVVLGGTIDGYVYSLDTGVSDNGTDIDMTVKSARMNPFVKTGTKARLGWLQLLVDTNLADTMTINLYSDHNTIPYKTYTVALTDGKGQEKSWLNIPSGVAAQFHQVEMIHSGSAGGVAIHAMVPYFQEGGPVR